MVEHTLHSIAFPVLTEDQIAQVANCTAVAPRKCRDGETLISVGERALKFFIVKSGHVDIVDESGDEPKTLVVHEKGNFTGDISHLTGTPVMVSAVARGNDCEVFEISSEALRHVLNQCPTLSDIILQA